jgi:hypothetical protein
MTRSSARHCAVAPVSFAALLTGVLLSASTTNAALVYALTDENDLISFLSESPQDLLDAGAITGLGGQDLIGIDARPATNQLYGIGNFGGIFTIDRATKAATQVATLNVPLVGSRFGLDFNPVVDRLRIVSDVEQNLRVNVDTGVAVVDSLLQYGPGQPGATGDNPHVVHAAYTNSGSPAPASTTLYDLDVRVNEDRLVTQNPPNSGTLNVVGALSDPATAVGGFDILFQYGINTGYAALQHPSEGISRLHLVNLSAGFTIQLGVIGGGDLIDGIAVFGIPEPASFGMSIFALIGGVAIRRRNK